MSASVSNPVSAASNTEPALLSDDFLGKFPDFPEHMNALGQFVLLRTYSRFLPAYNRRETHKEICARAAAYNIGLAVKHLKSIGYKVDYDAMKRETELLFSNMFNLKQFVSGRSLWVGGTKAVEKAPCANFNCAFLNISSWDDLGDLFYMLLIGTGVGFRCGYEMAKCIPKIRIGTHVIHSPYHPLPASERLELSQFTTLPNGYAKIYIGDSKEAWVSSLRYFFQLLTDPKYEYVHTIKLSYNSIRPQGERLKTFGGQASGATPLIELYAGIDNVLKSKLDTNIDPIVPDENGYGRVRPIHVLDMGNLIGSIVQVGGCRRTAEIFLFDNNDLETLFAKYGINGLWTEDHIANHRRLGEKLDGMGIKPKWFDNIQKIGDGRFNLNHRRMSNNSIAFTSKPSDEFLKLVFDIMKNEAEPGFINLEAANRRRPNCQGLNPCLTGDSMILTSTGLQPIIDLVGKKFNAIVDGEEYESTDKGFWKTGAKPVYKIVLDNGQEIKATDNHEFRIQTGTKTKDWRETKDLKAGDKLVLSDNNSYKWKSDIGTFEEGYFCGQLIGDGTFYTTQQNTEQPCIDLWVPTEYGLDDYGPAKIISSWAETLSYRSDANGFKKQVQKGEEYQKYRMNISAFRDVAEKYEIRPIEKKVYERGSYDYTRGLLQGFFDADGSVQGEQSKGVSVRLGQSDLGRLQSVQRLLLSMGIYSKIFQNRRVAGKRSMPDCRGGYKDYDCKAQHELIISNDALFKFESIIGFADNAKSARLKYILSQYVRKPNKTNFVSKVISVDPCGEEDVYDATVPSTHCFSANGILAHNCAEILLDSYGVCNLTTVNLVQFVTNTSNGKILNIDDLVEAQRLSSRCGLRMTLVTLELPHWDAIQKRDRLLGTSLTGVKDALDMLDYTQEDEKALIKLLGDVAREEADKYAKQLRVNCPLLVSALKPEGSLSQIANSVSCGLHLSHSPYYIRRIRINAADPLAKTVLELGWVVNPEVGTKGATYEEKMSNARVLVIDFPVASGAKKTKYDTNVDEQFQTYFNFQRLYTEHNSSNTISLRAHEWDRARELIYNNWDEYVGVSFISLDDHTYELAPYEECTEQEYLELRRKTKPFDMSMLIKNENLNEDFTLGKSAGGCVKMEDAASDSIELPLDSTAESCVGGVCPIR